VSLHITFKTLHKKPIFTILSCMPILFVLSHIGLNAQRDGWSVSSMAVGEGGGALVFMDAWSKNVSHIKLGSVG